MRHLDRRLNNNPTLMPGGTIRNLSFYNGASARGGFGLVGYNYNDRYASLHFDGLGINLASAIENGTSAHAGATGNHHRISATATESIRLSQVQT